MNNKIIVFLAALLSVGFLMGCGGKEPAEQQDPLSSDDNKILKFTINGVEGKIFWYSYDETHGFDYITLTLPYATDFSSLVPEIEVSPGATVVPAPGTAVDCSSGGCVYSVTDAKGLMRVYSVDVYRGDPMYRLGDYYPDAADPATAIGVVFSLDKNCEHGKIVSCDEAAGLKWAVAERNEFDESVKTGEQAMAWIKSNRDINDYPAFKWCADKGEGWYLPGGSDELYTILRLRHSTINPAMDDIDNAARIKTNVYYLEALQWDEWQARGHAGLSDYNATDYGYKTFVKSKTGECRVRAVRRF